MSLAETNSFSEAEAQALLEREEGPFLESKSLWDLSTGSRRTLDRRKARDLVAEYVAAFANADGGTLILGVEDDGTSTGHGYPPEAVADRVALGELLLQLLRTVRCRALAHREPRRASREQRLSVGFATRASAARNRR
jgi:ATP-dependent DNA helicase RecG